MLNIYEPYDITGQKDEPYEHDEEGLDMFKKIQYNYLQNG